jgi:hypothetical protein
LLVVEVEIFWGGLTVEYLPLDYCWRRQLRFTMPWSLERLGKEIQDALADGK